MNTVGELRKLLRGLPAHAPVVATTNRPPDDWEPNVSMGCMRVVEGVLHVVVAYDYALESDYECDEDCDEDCEKGSQMELFA